MSKIHKKPHTTPVIYGLDIGGTKIEIGVFTPEFNLIESWRVPTPTEEYDKLLLAISSLIFEADKRFLNCVSIGIGMPGIIDRNNRVKSANVPCATGKVITDDLKKLIDREISIANDCRLFALSESIGGAGDKKGVVYGAIIGTGAGGGLCINGRLFRTKNNIAGEYGHIGASGMLLKKYNLPVRNCGCGLIGCFESYIAGPGLNWLYNYFGAKNISTPEFVNHLRLGKPLAKKTFECYMELLGASFASLVLSYDPDVIVVGGGLSKVDEIINNLPRAINNHLFTGVISPEIKRASFGDSSGVRGAAILGSTI